MQQNRQVVEEVFDRWATGQGSILDLMDEDGTVVVPGISAHCGTLSKQEFVAKVAKPFMSRFSKPPVPRPSKIMTDGDDVIVIADAKGTTLDGKAYRNDYVFVLKFHKGNLVRVTEFLDMTAFNVVWDGVAPQIEAANAQEHLQ